MCSFPRLLVQALSCFSLGGEGPHNLLSCFDRCTDLEGTELDDDGNGSDTGAHEVFVGGLPPDANDEDVKQAFEAAGEVLSVRLNRRKKTGECKGFGFIRFADPETAEKATIEVREVHAAPFSAIRMYVFGCWASSGPAVIWMSDCFLW